jgi:hypothetical protein
MKKIFRCFWILLLFLFRMDAARAQVDYTHCKVIITDGLRELDVETDSTAYLNTVFDRHCESGGTVKESGFSLGLDAIVEAIPLKFSLGSSDKKQAMRNFCKEYHSYAAGDRTAFRRNERIVSRAYDSYDTCVSMATQGVKVFHQIRTLYSLDFFLSPAVGRTLALNGVNVTPNIKCWAKALQVPGSIAEELDLNTEIILKDKPLNITCDREGRMQTGGGVVYDEGVVTLLTDLQPNGNYGVVLPHDERLPEGKASQLDAAIRSQATKVDELQRTLEMMQGLVVFTPEVSWSQGQPAVPLGVKSDEGLCFLTRITGKFMGGGEEVAIRYTENGFVLTGSSQQDGVAASARCLKRVGRNSN